MTDWKQKANELGLPDEAAMWRHFKGVKDRYIAGKIGVSKFTVNNRRLELGYKKQKRPNPKIKKLKSLPTAEMTIPELAKEIDASVDMTSRYLKRHNLKYKRLKNRKRYQCEFCGKWCTGGNRSTTCKRSECVEKRRQKYRQDNKEKYGICERCGEYKYLVTSLCKRCIRKRSQIYASDCLEF